MTIDPIRAKAVLLYHDPEFQYYCGQLGLRTFAAKWAEALMLCTVIPSFSTIADADD